MAEAVKPRVVALFVEDEAHERFISALVKKAAAEEAVTIQLKIGAARGGHGRALHELDLYQRLLSSGREGGARVVDLLVVAIDGNCMGWGKGRSNIETKIDKSLFPAHAIACPDPHIERWFLADPLSFNEAFEATLKSTKRKCERDLYKQLLIEALTTAGHTLTLDGVEFAQEIVDVMSLYRAGKNEPSLKHFVEELRTALRSQAR